jgi:hypothetical protein
MSNLKKQTKAQLIDQVKRLMDDINQLNHEIESLNYTLGIKNLEMKHMMEEAIEIDKMIGNLDFYDGLFDNGFFDVFDNSPSKSIKFDYMH